MPPDSIDSFKVIANSSLFATVTTQAASFFEITGQNIHSKENSEYITLEEESISGRKF